MDQTPKAIAAAIWPLLKPPSGTNPVIRYFAKRGDKKIGGWFRSEAHFAATIEGLRDGGWDAYIQLNPSFSRAGIRGCAEDTAFWAWVMLDFDPKNPGPWSQITTAAFMTPEKLLRRRESDEEETLPTVIVSTGRGTQYWYKLRIPIIMSPKGRVWARATNAKIMKTGYLENDGESFKLDYLPDLPRLVRMPGTFNSKNGRFSKIVELHEERFIDGALAMTLTPYPDEPDPIPAMEGLPWQKVFSHLPPSVKTFIMEGVESGDRHRLAYATAAALMEAGLTLEAARVALFRGADRCRPPREADSTFTTFELNRILYGVFKNG